MTKYETAATLLQLLYQANQAGTEHAEEWQTPDMNQGLFRDLAEACRKVLGDDLYEFVMEGDMWLNARELKDAEERMKLGYHPVLRWGEEWV
tara:strand:+ start:4386 stop:4661 length:276 start_codon:yes stop_codon:yes gene_type:complete